MPGTSRATNPRGIQITFTEDDHKYRSLIDGNEILYTSGTQFLGKYFPQFDPTGEIAARCAKKQGISVAELKAQWDAKGKESCRLGTRLHETIEDTLLRQSHRNTAENDEEQRRFDNGIAVAQKLLQKTKILGVEKIVFSDSLKIAGTIDLLCQAQNGGTYYIIDHKTNKSIDKENPYKKFCLDPISHLDDTNYIHYGLQLNLYEYLMKREGYVPHDAKFRLFLNHITADVSQLIELPDLQLEIRDLVIDFLLNGKNVKAPYSKQKPANATQSHQSLIDTL